MSEVFGLHLIGIVLTRSALHRLWSIEDRLRAHVDALERERLRDRDPPRPRR